MKAKLWFFLIVGMVILGLVFYGYFTATPGIEREGGPKIEITPQSFNFGNVSYGKIAEYTFQVKNAGNEILEIKRVATSCSCTRAEISQEKIAPGQTAELQVVYDTGAMSGPHGKGKQERIIYLKSSDPVNPQAEVIIYADVK